jgi:hypothetical protein
MQQAWWYQQGCYKLLTACFKLVDNVEQAERTQLVDDFVSRLAVSVQDVRFLRGCTGYSRILYYIYVNG